MNAGFVKALCIVLAVAPTASFGRSGATQSESFYRFGPASVACVVEAARKQNVPANVLLAIASLEGGRNGQSVKNKNGSFDMGHFQLNTIHFAENGVFTRAGIDKRDAAWRGCYNAELAAWMVSRHVNAPGNQDFWIKVANYHSATPQFNAAYRAKLIPLAERWGKWLQANYSTTASYR